MKRHESGSTLSLALSVIATLMVCVGVALEYTQNVNRNVQRSYAVQAAQSIGEGALESAFNSWREVCRQSPNLALPTSSFVSIALPGPPAFPGMSPAFTSSRSPTPNPSTTLANFSVKAVDPQLNALLDTTPPPPATWRNPGTNSYFYLASADVTIPSASGQVTQKMRRVLEKQVISPWQWAIFYQDPLEIHPGPPFTVTGWVHTNSNLYTGHNTLNFAAKVTYADDWSIGFMPGDPRTETPTSPTWPYNLPPARDIEQLASGQDDSKIFNTTDNNVNNDGYHELIERPADGADADTAIDPDPLAGQRVYNQAGVKILISDSPAANTVVIKNAAGTTVTSSSTGNNKKLYDAFKSAITTNNSIQDNREQATVRLANLDVSVITTAMNAVPPALPGFNGIIHISDTSAGQTGGSPKRGVRLKNGASLPTGGLTIASDNPVYIWGDFNTGKTSSSNPPSNTGDPTKPTVSTYTRQPSAILADAVTILSNSWLDANSTAPSLSSRVASNTTVNAAILAGIVPTTPGNYSGGVENFPRFLEDWSNNKTLTYYGSMVELYSSKQAVGKWGKSNVYSPPLRQWYFDKGFQLASPKGTFQLTNYIKQRWFIE